MLSNEFTKWLFGLCGAGLTAFVSYVWNKKIKKGFSLIEEENKEEFLKEVNDRISEDENKMEEADKALDDKICSIVDVLNLLKEGILSLHLDSLIDECKYHIEQGWIPVDALERFEEKYNLYKKLGGNGDLVIFGITRCASRTPNQYVVPAEYEEVKDKERGSHTLLAGICHTFFEINNPPAFIQKIGDIYGTKAERAQKSFDIIDGFLDNIEAELSKK